MTTLVLAAQDGLVYRGEVIDAGSRRGIKDVTVEFFYKGVLEQRVLTDAEGRYSYTPKVRNGDGYRVGFSHVSYESDSLALDPQAPTIPTVRLRPRENVLDEYVVTTTRNRQKIEDLPLPVSVVAPVDIKRIAPMDTKDILLYSIPGVEMGMHGYVTSIKIQGYSADYYAFLIDGEEIAGLKSGSPDFSRLSPENIERVEVIKGAGSALYGSSAIGGVVNIITKQAKEPISGYLTGSYTMPGEWNTYGQFGLNRKKWGNTLSASVGREGDYTISTKDKSREMLMPRNDIYRVVNRFDWRPSRAFTLKVDLSGSHRKQYRSEYQHDHYDYLCGRLRGVYDLGEHSSLAVSYNGDYSLRDRYYPKVPGKHDIQHSNYKHLLRVHYNNTFSDGSNLATGVEGYQELMLSDQIDAAKAQKKIAGAVLYGQYLRQLGAGFEVLGGLRADLHATYGLNLSPKLTLSYKWDELRVRATYARAFKSPSMMDLYYNWSHQGMFFIYGNPNLKPEIANQFLLGADYRAQKVRLSAGASYTLFKDQITKASTKDGNITHVNIEGRTKRIDADATVEWFVCNGFSVKGMYSYAYNPSPVEHLGKTYDVSSTRPHNVMLQLNGFKQWGDFALNASIIGQYLSAIDYDTYETKMVDGVAEIDKSKPMIKEHFDGYPLLRLTTTATYKERYTLTLGGNNLLNFRPSNLVFQTSSFSPGAVFFAKIGVRLP